ncbi:MULTISPECIES: outer membrane protein [unclassified Yoonia]|uniref:outer membrane protein n=1 Tax=unclassified Yoonia TaxID=2629118 RepID=UPI002AFFB627|nr:MULTISPECIES: outer membrane beta-barrel protein [unclassified Yoonia]
MADFKMMTAALLAATTSLAGAVAAQDFQQDWEGFYAGLHAEASIYDVVVTDLNNSFLSQSPNLSILAGHGGVTGGYNYALQGNLIVGAEIDYTSELRIDEFFSSNSAATTGTQYDLALEGILALKGRAAYVQGNALGFMSVGVASATTSMETYSINTSTAVTACDDSNCARSTEDLLGLTMGVGAEWAFRENWIGRVEFQHYAFESVQAPVRNSADLPFCATGDTDQCTIGYTPSVSSVRFGLSYKF